MPNIHFLPPSLYQNHGNGWLIKSLTVHRRSVSPAACHRRSSFSVLSGYLFSLSYSRFGQFHRQALVITDKMVIPAPPIQMIHQFRCILRRALDAAGQFTDRLPNGQIQSFHECGVDPPAQTRILQALPILLFLSTNHAPLDVHRSISSTVFNHLAIHKLAQQCPHRLLPVRGFPLPQMGCQSIKVVA